MNSFHVSREIPITQIKIDDRFWSEKIKVNAESAIFHQWNKLEESGTIDNFRIINDEIDKFREGFFYVDSDAHKWAEAAATVLQTYDDKRLFAVLTTYLDLLSSAQENDGYIFTYNQFHFPGKRWVNHQIEHELYTLGHLIEASIVAYKVTDSEKYLELGKKTADLLVRQFYNTRAKRTPGHPEIELALIKLYKLTKDENYLSLAKRFVYKRGKFLLFGSRIFRENLSQQKRADEVTRQKDQYYEAIVTKEKIMSDLSKDGPKGLQIRFFLSAFTGKYFQQNIPVRRQKKPVGHCVRWGYLATAATMIYQETGDVKLLSSLQKAWDEMVKKRMYVTGGIGSLPLLEGFGKDYELNNKFAYNETCAAISSVFWNWEMLLSTGDAKYADLIEWQLYNAVLVGMSADGKSYFYRNPLEVDKTFERKEWYKTACCPSNISRTLANLAKYVYSFEDRNLWIHQYIGNTGNIQLNENLDSEIQVEMKSDLPWGEKVEIILKCKDNLDFFLNIRIPSWTSNPEVIINRKKIEGFDLEIKEVETASDLTAYRSYYFSLKEQWKKENKIELTFPMKIKFHQSHKKVKNNTDKVAISRGPIVYCFEDTDNPAIDLASKILNLEKAVTVFEDEGILKIRLHSEDKQAVVTRPYYSWGNKGKSSMNVWLSK